MVGAIYWPGSELHRALLLLGQSLHVCCWASEWCLAGEQALHQHRQLLRTIVTEAGVMPNVFTLQQLHLISVTGLCCMYIFQLQQQQWQFSQEVLQ